MSMNAKYPFPGIPSHSSQHLASIWAWAERQDVDFLSSLFVKHFCVDLSMFFLSAGKFRLIARTYPAQQALFARSKHFYVQKTLQNACYAG